MRRARRRVGVCVVACLLLLQGCALRPRPVTLAIALLPSELPAYRAAVEDFATQNGVRVQVVPQQYAEIRRALAAEAAGGGGALDLVELDVYSLAAAAPLVAPLPEAELAAELEALDASALAAGRIDGLRFLPHRVSWQALIYDSEVLPKPPQTWDELLAVARAYPGRVGLKGAEYEGLTCDLLPFVWEAGGSGSDLDDAGARAAFAFFAKLAPLLDPRSAIFKEATIAEAMARGELILHLNWPFAMRLYASEGLAPGRIRSAPLPAGPAGRATVLGGGYVGIPANAPHREQALRLLRYLLSRPVQTRLARELGWFSARRDVPLTDDEALFGGFLASRADARPRPERADYLALSRSWQQAFREVVFGGADPDAVLRAAAQARSEQARR